MASENNKWLQRALAPTLKPLGFKKSGATWRKDDGEAISVLNIQGSWAGPSFYINVGVYFRALGDLDQPNEYQCHLRERLETLLPARPQRERMVALLDFEQGIQDDVRAREVEALVLEYCLPWLTAVSTIQGAREYLASIHPRKIFVTKEARAFLA